MSPRSRSTLHDRLSERLHDEFGDPADAVGSNARWSLRPSPQAVAIDLAINCDLERPTVGVFDPYDQATGVEQVVITHDDDIEQIVNSIHNRLRIARMQQPVDAVQQTSRRELKQA